VGIVEELLNEDQPVVPSRNWPLEKFELSSDHPDRVGMQSYEQWLV